MPTRTTFADRCYEFFTTLKAPRVPKGVVVMNPYRRARVREYLRAFLDKYTRDNNPRVLAIGINPGRFGGGITGLSFTDPVVMTERGIANDLPQRRETSAEFIWRFIDAFGGPETFYSGGFFSAVSPLGFTKDGLNLNYYDVPALERAVTPFAVESLRRHIAIGGRNDVAIVIGQGKNQKFLEKLNAEHRFFDRLLVLPHPRWIMQYRRKRIDHYVGEYVRTFRAAMG